MADPKVRFKRDDGSSYPKLEGRKLGDIGTVMMCKRVLREQTVSEGEVPFYKIGTFGGIPDAFISRELYEELKAKYSFPKKGNILLSAAGTIGRTVRYDGEDAFFQDSNIVWLDHDDSILDDYLYYFYQQASWENLEGGTIQRLYNGILLDKNIHMPCLEEQQKIADFLSSVDEVIATCTEKVKTLETQKKAVMKKIFSQEVRFKQEDGTEFPEWEEAALNDISERIIVGLATTVTPYYRENGVPMFRNLNIRAGYLDDINILYLDEEYASKQSGKYIHAGDILTVHTGNIGWSCVVPDCYEGALSFTTLITTLKKSGVINDYVCAYLNSDLGMKQMQDLAFSGGRANLNTNEFQKVVLPIPALEEQRLIAGSLSDFDEAIAVAKKELELWKELKKGLLQKMFV